MEQWVKKRIKKLTKKEGGQGGVEQPVRGVRLPAGMKEGHFALPSTSQRDSSLSRPVSAAPSGPGSPLGTEGIVRVQMPILANPPLSTGSSEDVRCIETATEKSMAIASTGVEVANKLSCSEESPTQSPITTGASTVHSNVYTTNTVVNRSLYNHTGNSSSPGVRAQPSLWELAIEQLSNDERKLLGNEIEDLTNLGAGTSTAIVEQLLQCAQQKSQDCKKNRWRAQIEKIVDSTTKFRQINKIVVQSPAHTALPWAGFVLILQLTVVDLKLFGQIVTGLELISRFITECAIYGGMYLYLSEEFEAVVPPSLRQKFSDCILEVYGLVLSYLLKSLYCCRQSSLEKPVKRLWDFKDLQGLLTRITTSQIQLRDNVHLLQIELHKGSDEAILKRVRDLHEHFDGEFGNFVQNLDTEIRSDVLEWLSQIDYPNHHELAKEGYTPGTGKWLLEHEDFIEWRESNAPSFLWLKGNVGTGKTKLASLVIESLRRCDQSPQALAYFYCSRDDPQRRKPAIILSTLIKQLSCLGYKNLLQKAIVDEYETQKKKSAPEQPRPLNFEHAQRLAKALLDIHPQSFIVVDALDECEEDNRSKLLNMLYELAVESGSLVKVFVTSRIDEVSIPKFIPTVVLESGGRQSDIQLIAEEKTNEVLNRRNNLITKLEPNEVLKFKEDMIQILVNGAEGIPLWITHQINNILNNQNEIKTPKQLIATLQSFPSGLTATYKYMLGDLLKNPEKENNPLGITALKWVMTSIRPLHPDEFLGAVYLEHENRGEGDSGNSATTFNLQDILSICCNLLVHDKKEDVIRFHHLSVREFLEDHANDLFTKDIVQARSDLIERPLFRFCEIESWDKEEWRFTSNTPECRMTLPKFEAFCVYIALSWPAYYDKKSKSETLVHFILHSPAYNAWLSFIHWFQMRHFDRKQGKLALLERGWYYIRHKHPIQYPNFIEFWKKERELVLWERNPLYVCAHWGLSNISQQLIQNGADARVFDMLILEARRGREEIVRFLVENVTGANDPEALKGAAEEGHKQIVMFLVEHGANANNAEALKLAAKGGHEQIVEYLVENGDGKHPEALKLAADGGNEQIVRLLVKNGADATDPAVLTAAAKSLSKSLGTVKFLVQKGANVNNLEALKAAASGAHEPILRFLIENGADATDPAVLTAAAGSWTDALELVKFLVQNGANANNPEALELAVKSGHEQVVRFLVENGADATGPAVLTAAAGSGWQELVKLRYLVRYGSNIVNPEALADEVLEKIVRFLVENGADAKHPEALKLAAEKGHERIVRFLVEKGADATDPAVLIAVGRQWQEQEMVKSIIYRGTSNNDPEAMKLAVEKGRQNIVRFLVENGADIRVLDPAKVELEE